MIKNFEPRLYQEAILNTASLKNTLVVLPTGLGKTNIFLMLAALRLKQYPSSKILLVGPTKPLIDQYLAAFKKHFDIEEEKMAVFTGEVKPDKRAELWEKSQIIFSTPQTIENDVISSKINLKKVSLLGIDEAHRAVSNYSYVWLAKQYEKAAKYSRIIGLTASPGSDMEKIKEVCQNLSIEEIEARTEEDPDVKPYVQETEIKWVEVELPQEFKKIKTRLENILKQKIKRLKSWGIVNKRQKYLRKKELLSMQASLHKEAVAEKDNYKLWQSISIVAEIIKVQHCLELLETQGLSPLKEYFEKVRHAASRGKVKAVKNLMNNPEFKSAIFLTEKLFEDKIEHPKLKKLREIIKKYSKESERMIVFSQYRDSASKIKDELNKIRGIDARLFVGQMKKKNTGMSQKEQKKMLDDFREDKFDILVATSIAEEGLDIPKVDAVIFYEPIPSAIRHIQRKGRTGRQEKGKVIILMAKDTRDVAFRWSSHHKQKRMYRVIDKIKNNMDSPLKNKSKEKKLNEYIKDSVLIIADQRERSSQVIRGIKSKGADIKIRQLKAADYMCSKRTAIEYKKVKDFVDSIVDKRLLEQMKKIRNNYERPILIIEGEQDIYKVRKVHPHAIQGMLATIAINYNIPIIQTKNSEETASLLYIIAKREQEQDKEPFHPHASKSGMSLKERQEYIISSLPDIGPVLAKDMLKRFGSVSGIINADKKELTSVEGIGKKKAEYLKEVIDKEYN